MKRSASKLLVPLSKSYDQTQVRASIASNLEPYSSPFLYKLNCFGILFHQASKHWLDMNYKSKATWTKKKTTKTDDCKVI